VPIANISEVWIERTYTLYVIHVSVGSCTVKQAMYRCYHRLLVDVQRSATVRCADLLFNIILHWMCYSHVNHGFTFVRVANKEFMKNLSAEFFSTVTINCCIDITFITRTRFGSVGRFHVIMRSWLYRAIYNGYVDGLIIVGLSAGRMLLTRSSVCKHIQFNSGLRLLAEWCYIVNFSYCHKMSVVYVWRECIVTKWMKPGSRGFHCEIEKCLNFWQVWPRNFEGVPSTGGSN